MSRDICREVATHLQHAVKETMITRLQILDQCCPGNKNYVQFCGGTHLMTMLWWVLSGSPLGFAEVIARGPVMSHRWPVTVWSGTRIMMLSLVPTRS